MKRKPTRQPMTRYRRAAFHKGNALLQAQDGIAHAVSALRALESILTTSREPLFPQLAYLLDPVIDTLAQAKSALQQATRGDIAYFKKEK